MINIIFSAIWFILPAYFANMAPVFISKIKRIQKYNKPIDFGKKIKGKEILGSGKTWFGFIFGVVVGTIIGALQGNYYLGFMLGLGALVGDSVASFIKRQLNISRGKKAPILDQLDFIIGAFLFSALIITFNWIHFVIIIIITPAIHLVSNIIGYKLKLKNEPW